jgi:hypothetical protein
MMIDHARASRVKQYIIITPQSMDNVPIGADVKVIKMGDPERLWAGGQLTLEEGFARQ